MLVFLLFVVGCQATTKYNYNIQPVDLVGLNEEEQKKTLIMPKYM